MINVSTDRLATAIGADDDGRAEIVLLADQRGRVLFDSHDQWAGLDVEELFDVALLGFEADRGVALDIRGQRLISPGIRSRTLY